MNIGDLNLLRAFLVFSEELNLTRSSKRLGLSQPALSHALARLRAEFKDSLFVRGPRGLIATDRAKALAPQVRRVLELAESLYKTEVDLPAVEKRFVLASTTYFELRVLARLLRSLSRALPRATLETRSLQGEFPKEELERGEIDVAVAAYFDRIPEGFRVKTLGLDTHVCVVRAKHPYLKSRRALYDYLKASHVRISIPPGSLGHVDRILQKKGQSRRIVMHVGNFLTAPFIVAKSDLILTCPDSLARSYAKTFPLEVVEAPIPIPPLEIKMVWHERTQSDSAQQWLRDELSRLLVHASGR